MEEIWYILATSGFTSKLELLGPHKLGKIVTKNLNCLFFLWIEPWTNFMYINVHSPKSWCYLWFNNNSLKYIFEFAIETKQKGSKSFETASQGNVVELLVGVGGGLAKDFLQHFFLHPSQIAGMLYILWYLKSLKASAEDKEAYGELPFHHKSF